MNGGRASSLSSTKNSADKDFLRNKLIEILVQDDLRRVRHLDGRTISDAKTAVGTETT